MAGGLDGRSLDVLLLLRNRAEMKKSTGQYNDDDRRLQEMIDRRILGDDRYEQIAGSKEREKKE